MKIELPKNTDQTISVTVAKYEVAANGEKTYLGAETLSSYDRIELYLHKINEVTPIEKYSIADPTPTGYKVMTTTDNKLNFTIYSETTDIATVGDVYYTVKLWSTGTRVDGGDYKKMTDKTYLVTLTEPVGYKTA